MAVCISHAAFSFTNKDTLREQYVESYPEKFYIKPVYTVRNLRMIIRSRTTGKRINYHPNGNNYFGIGVFLFNLGVEASFKLPENGKSNKIYGETELFDFQSNIYAKKWGADVTIQQYDGFFVNNPQTHYPSWQQNDPYPQRPDLSINQIILNGFYFFNHKKFSYRSAYKQVDRQRKNGGTLLAGINYLYQEIEADSSLIPYENQPVFGNSMFNNSELSAFGILAGYTHSFVKKYFYLNFSTTAGPQYVWSDYHDGQSKQAKNHITPLINFRAAFGYNSPKWFAGVTYINQRSNLLTKKLDIGVESGNIKFFVGFRLQEKGILKKEII